MEKDLMSSGKKVVMRFIVASDTHISNVKDLTAQRLAQMFSTAYSYAENQEYKTVDAAVIVGDMTNEGLASEFEAFKTVVRQSIREQTHLCAVLGNHEYAHGTNEPYRQCISEQINYHFTVKGYHFIGLALNADDLYDDETIAFLKEELAKAAETAPNQPIFVFQHRHILNTVYVSTEWYSAQSKQLDDIMKEYPQVIDFSGHSHGPINNPTSVYQKDYTLVGTGTLFYFEMTSGMTYGTIPPGSDKAAQYWIVEVHGDQSVELKPYNLLTNDFFRVPSNTEETKAYLSYLVEPAKGKDGFRYADREETASKPYFEDGTELTVQDVRPCDLKLVIPQAKDAQCIYSYRIVFASAASRQEYNYFSDYYFEPMPDSISCCVGQLEPATEYTITVYPVNCYGKEGNPISVNVTTPKENETVYSTMLKVNYEGTFANFDYLSTLKLSDSTLVYGGIPNGDAFAGDWCSGTTGTGSVAALAGGKGYHGSCALGVSSTISKNQGLYIFANETNRFSTKFTRPKYLRVWVDFRDVDFRKACFGVFTGDGSLYTSDEMDGKKNLLFYYLPDGSAEWNQFTYGPYDGCWGTAEGPSVKGFRGWLACPLTDFGHRDGTGAGSIGKGIPFSGGEIAGFYLFWDYDKHADYTGEKFYLDEIHLVEDYRVFEEHKQ